MTTLRMHGMTIGIGEELQPVDLSIRSVMKREQPFGDATLEVCVLSGQHRLLTIESFPGGERAVTWPSLMSVDLDPTFAHASIIRESGVDAEYESILLSPLVGAVAMLRGSLVLHSSAIEIDGVATLLVGHSGSGKTSVAAMLCAAGARLISDDVCVLTSCDNRPIAVSQGLTELRLRTTSESLISLFNHRPQRISIDRRCVVSPTPTTQDQVLIRRIVIVMLDRDATTCSVERIAPNHSLAYIMRALRFPPEADSPQLLRDFYSVAKLVDQIEVVEARVPWGIPVTTELASQVARAIATDPTDSVITK